MKSLNAFYVDHSRDIYAGVLGKMIGVYLGRPVEGWPYEDIERTFGEMYYYVHETLNLPLIVADDDLSGTFGFFRTIMDNSESGEVTSKEIGNTWLNYIIEDRTILWWGGFGRSTEHTAFLQLKKGIEAPHSGSFIRNGPILPEQIGAQIFIDAYALMCPDDPDQAVRLIREAARVSHDGIAVEAACYLGALESMAFSEKSVDRLLDAGLQFITNRHLLTMIEDVRNYCVLSTDWREVRTRIAEKYGYGIYDGPCHIVPNHAVVLASLILGGDSFRKSLMIAVSSAWDTDCNAGNVGCLNGIRLGLDAVNREADYRGPVKDRMLVVTADSGSCISDAVIETRKIIQSAATSAGFDGYDTLSDTPRFTFEFPGSVQGFQTCPFANPSAADISVSNGSDAEKEFGLLISLGNCTSDVPGFVSTPTFLDFDNHSEHFKAVASPTLYETQQVRAEIDVESDEPLFVTPYVLVYGIDNRKTVIEMETWKLDIGTKEYRCQIPDTGGMPIFRFGFKCFTPLNRKNSFLVKLIDWKGAPAEYAQRGVLMKSIWDVKPFWLQVWASSARQFAPDFLHTYCISHTEANGLVTQGTADWTDYSLETGLFFSLHDRAGVVVRSRGHRRYYAALFSGGDTISLIARRDSDEDVLAVVPYRYAYETAYRVIFSAVGTSLTLFVNGIRVAEVQHESYRSGAAGYVIDTGTMLAHDFIIRGERV